MIPTASFITAFLLFLAGLLCCYLFIKPILSPIFNSLKPYIPKLPEKGGKERSLLSRCEKNLLYAESLIQEKKYESGAKEIFSSICYETFIHSPKSIGLVTHHHNKLLSLTIELADALGKSVPMLPLLEELFSKRNKLLVALLENENSLKRLKKKWKEKRGKDTPKWSLGEFKEKREGYLEELNTNRDVIKNKMEESLTMLFSKEDDEKEHYH